MSAFALDQLTRMDLLRRLHVRGWRFHRRHSPDPPHELDELVYSFLHGEWLDILRVHSDSVAMAGRFLAESVIAGRPRTCWSVDGTLAEVLDALITLPPPGTVGGPRLLGGSAPFDPKPDAS